MENKLNIAIIGAGGFAAFAAQAFLKVQGASIVGVTDINENTGNKLANELNATFFPDVITLLSDQSVTLVYIATPPHLHYKLSKEALSAGKHVICEKPAALHTSQAIELIQLAADKQVLFVVNLMQRYNPLYDIVSKIIKGKVIGNFLHGFFENYASDENLKEKHWFWDHKKSGGIFIEHGVHFFDMFSGWLGKGKLINSVEVKRPGIKQPIYDRVQASVLYENGIVNYYHGFDQPGILDRQEMRLQFEYGDITLYEWVPGTITFNGLITNHDLNNLNELFRGLNVKEVKEQASKKEIVSARGKQIVFNNKVTIKAAHPMDKKERYQKMVSDMLADQWQWIRDRSHIRVIDDVNAVESLSMAEEASNLSQKL